MNQQRRTEINKVKLDISESLPDIKTLFGMIQSWKESLEGFRDEEQEYFDNMPEGLQSGEKGDKATAAIETLEEAISKFDDFVPLEDVFDEVITHLEVAAE